MNRRYTALNKITVITNRESKMKMKEVTVTYFKVCISQICVRCFTAEVTAWSNSPDVYFLVSRYAVSTTERYQAGKMKITLNQLRTGPSPSIVPLLLFDFSALLTSTLKMFLQNVSNHLQDYIVSQPRRLQFELTLFSPHTHTTPPNYHSMNIFLEDTNPTYNGIISENVSLMCVFHSFQAPGLLESLPHS
jgi:hypothetical protein